MLKSSAAKARRSPSSGDGGARKPSAKAVLRGASVGAAGSLRLFDWDSGRGLTRHGEFLDETCSNAVGAPNFTSMEIADQDNLTPIV